MNLGELQAELRHFAAERDWQPYWTVAQQLAHHTSNGCNLKIGDLLGSGTISGEQEGSWGSFMEISRNGSAPWGLNTGDARTFLHDGDVVRLSGRCVGDGYVVGFGDATGEVFPAIGSSAFGIDEYEQC